MADNETKEDKVWITVSHTINLGNFESYKIDAGFSKTIIDKDPMDMLNEMHHELGAFVLSKGKRIKAGLDAIDELKRTRRKKRV